MKYLTFFTVLPIAFFAAAQQNVLPFTGLRYESRGIAAENVSIELDGAAWTSNRLPVDTEFEIKLEDPTGFTAMDDLYFPGVEVLITRPNGDTLGYAPDIMGGEEFGGFSGLELSNLSLTLAFNEQTTVGDTCLLRARFFDRHSANEWLAFMDIVVVDPSLPLENTWSTFGVSSWEGYTALASGVEISAIAVSRDSLSPADTLSIDPIAGLALTEWQAGTLTVSAYDSNGNVSILPQNAYTCSVAASATDGALKAVFTTPQALSGQFETLRFRWQASDGTKVMDVVRKLR